MKIFMKKYGIKLAIISGISLIGTYIWFVIPAGIFPAGDIRKEDWLAFWGSFLSFCGTIVLGVVAVWQNEKVHELNRRLFEAEAVKSRAYVSVYSYKIFSNYAQYESYLSDNVLAFYTDTSISAIKGATPKNKYGDKRIRCIEFSLLGDMPALEMRIETTIKYYKKIMRGNEDRYNSILHQLNDIDDESELKLELVCVPVFSNTKRYLQLIPFKQYYVGCVDSININYRTLTNEKIKYEYRLLNFLEISKDEAVEALVSEKYFNVTNSEEKRLFDEIKYTSCRFQTNRKSVHDEENESRQ